MNHKSVQFLSNGDCNEWNEEQFELLEDLFKIFHVLLVSGDRRRGTQEFDPLSSPTRESIFRLASNDDSPLHRCIHALSQGVSLSSTLKKAMLSEDHRGAQISLWHKTLMSTWAMTDVIRHCRHKKAGAVKTIVGAQLQAHVSDQFVYTLLNDFGLSYGKKRTTNASYDDVKQMLLKGAFGKTKKYDYVIVCYDNLGFRVRTSRNRNCGYDQFTKVTFITDTTEDLISLKVYPDPTKSSTAQRLLSRERKDWLTERVKDDVGFEQVLKVNKDDVNLLADLSLSVIDALLEAESKGGLPTSEEAELMLEEQNYSTWSDPLPELFDSVQAVQTNEAQELLPQRRLDTGTTPLDANNATIDNPMELDLNSKETCRKLADYALEIKQHVLNSEDEGPFKGVSEQGKPEPFLEHSTHLKVQVHEKCQLYNRFW